jgi:hypothetical protein
LAMDTLPFKQEMFASRCHLGEQTPVAARPRDHVQQTLP